MPVEVDRLKGSVVLRSPNKNTQPQTECARELPARSCRGYANYVQVETVNRCDRGRQPSSSQLSYRNMPHILEDMAGPVGVGFDQLPGCDAGENISGAAR